MCSTFASVTPEFYLHHTYLDKLWFAWQQRSSACMKAKFSNSHKKMSKFGCPHSQSELIDSSKLPGHIRVAYTDYYYSGKMRKTAVYKKAQGYRKNSRDVSLENSNLFEDSDDEEPTDLDSEKFEDRDLDFLGWDDPEERARDEADNEPDEADEEDFQEHDLHSISAPSEGKFNDRPERVEEGSDRREEVPSDAEYDEGQSNVVENIAPGPVKYGETDYDFWDDIDLQSRESNEIRDENSDDKDCMKGKSVSTQSGFVPAFEKVCYKDYLNKILD